MTGRAGGRPAMLLVLVLCLPALVPLLRPGWFRGHDDSHLFRLIEYDVALRDGQWPPRWFPDISAGYGNPHPIYYAPLFYMTAEGFHLAGLGPVGALKAAATVFLILAALGMFWLVRRLWGDAAGAAAALAYTYVPYHLLDLYVREALSEFTVFACLPLLLVALQRLRDRGTRGTVCGVALAGAALALSHTISIMILPPLLLAWVALLSWPRPGETGRDLRAWLLRAAGAGAIGGLLAAFFLVPASLEREAINIENYASWYVDFHAHFVDPRQLLWWPWGFGMSIEGIGDGMSFRMGMIQIAGTVAALFGLRRLRRRGGEGARHVRFQLLVTVLAVFMMLPVSVRIWEAIRPLRFLQFPWRLLTLTSLSTSLLCGAAYAAFSTGGAAPAAADVQGVVAPAARSRGGEFRRLAPVAALGLILAGSAALGGMLGVDLRVPVQRIGFRNKPFSELVDRGPGAPPDPLNADFVRRNTLRWYDHLPPGVHYMGLGPEDLARPRAEPASGRARVAITESRSWRLRFIVDAETEALIRVNIYRFPGWTVRVDGAVVPLVEGSRQRRVIFFQVSPGPHEVEVVFERTGPRRLGDRLTLAGLASLAGVWLLPWGRAGRDDGTAGSDDGAPATHGAPAAGEGQDRPGGLEHHEAGLPPDPGDLDEDS
jgi:uncharacterized protein DUF6541